MQKLDRLVWANGIAFTSFGVNIGVRVNSPEIPDDVRGCLPPNWMASDSPFVDYLLSMRMGGSTVGVREFHLVYADVKQAARTMNREVAISVLETEIQLHIARNAKDRVFVHAGVVGWQGKAIVLPGKSHAGKSTLVKALLEAGATYYSDEFAVFDSAGQVHPYPRRLSLRRSGGTDRVPAETIGAETGNTPMPVGLIVRTEYRRGAEWNPQRMSPGKALMELASYTIHEVTHSAAGQDALGRIALSIPAYRSPRGEAAAAASDILRVLDFLPSSSQ
jgi:hypothetical protein